MSGAAWAAGLGWGFARVRSEWPGKLLTVFSLKERLRRKTFFSPLACGQPASAQSLRREYLAKRKLASRVLGLLDHTGRALRVGGRLA